MSHTPDAVPAPVRNPLLRVAEHFSPAWFASVMGTAVIPVALSFLDQPWVRPVAMGFMILAIVMFLLALGPWLTKFILFPGKVRHDLNHPIAGSFLPTMPIALIVIALDFLKYPDMLASPEVSRRIALWLWLAGSVGIYAMGMTILLHIFRHKEIRMEHANFGWYIPPVSKLLIPVAGLELAQLFPGWFDLAFGLSIASMGIGFFLFLFVGSTVYARYVYHHLPVSKIAATFFVGIAPTAIISVGLFKLMQLLQHQSVMGIDPAAVVPMLKLLILANWGLAAWWFVMGVFLMSLYIRSMDLPYALSWWAFTFPSGALAVSTGVAWKATGLGFLFWFYLGVICFLLAAWAIVAFRTGMGMVGGKVFQPAH